MRRTREHLGRARIAEVNLEDGAGDVAATIPWFLANYDSSEPVNISAGKRITIRELAETVKEVSGRPGQIVWDTTKPDGTMRKLMNVGRLADMGWKARIGLEQGLSETYQWFLANQDKFRT